MKRLLQCEEWAKLRVGTNLDVTPTELAALLRTWQQRTGTDAATHFDLRAGSITPKFWTGVLETEHIRLEVSPIGSTLLHPSSRILLDRNLSSMLAYALASQSMQAGKALLSTAGDRHESLIEVFCEELRLSRRRLVLRRYIAVRESVSSPKGRLAFPSQCFEAIRRPGRFSAEWVTLTEDISENRIFKAVLDRYRPRCSASLRGKIDACIADLDSVQRTTNLKVEWSKIRLDRLPESYVSLLDMSRTLLDDIGVGIFSGNSLANAEILFTYRLFERYIAKALAAVASEFSMQVLAQSRGTYLAESDNGTQSFEVIPDIRLKRSDGSTSLILDSKWKHVDANGKRLNISMADIYQLLVYGAKFGCYDLVLIYPDVSTATGERGSVRKFLIPLGGVEYSVHVLHVPMLGSSLNQIPAFLRRFLGIFISGVQSSENVLVDNHGKNFQNATLENNGVDSTARC